MGLDMIGAAGNALLVLMDPFRMMMLAVGVLVGLFVGIVPGIGPLTAMAIMLPFTLTMDPYAAIAMLLGMSAVNGSSDTIPAVLFGVPGSASAQATIMDGNPMAKKGEAGRALSAAFTASLLGGIFGAIILALAVPVLRPAILFINSPEMLAFTLFGISTVALLSGAAPIRGLIVAGVGIMLSMIGADSQTATTRWTFDQMYLWEGLPLVPMVLGLFALPELADLAIKKAGIAAASKYDTRAGRLQGVRDVFSNLWLTARCGAIGAAVGAIPGMGASVVDWIAYGHAKMTVKGANETFGKGDVRGVIAPESANNSITAGTLVPTVAFGVPGSPTMVILLSVLLIHGLVPGPDMLTIHLDVTYSMVWSIALANILGAGICFAFSGHLAKIALIRHTLILPIILTFVFLGAFQATKSWGDLYTMLTFAVVGWTMKQLKWSRPPLLLGFVLGGLIERYMYLSFGLYGGSWVFRPVVMILIAISVAIMAWPLIKQYRVLGGVGGITRSLSKPVFRANDLFYVFIIALSGVLIYTATGWPSAARFGPILIGSVVLALSMLGLLYQVFSRGILQARVVEGDEDTDLHMDTPLDYGELTRNDVLMRSAVFMVYLLVFFALIVVVGFLAAIPLFVAAYMWGEGRERFRHILTYAVVLAGVIYLVFDRFMHLAWPTALIDRLFM